jgi:hypothetical protein
MSTVRDETSARDGRFNVDRPPMKRGPAAIKGAPGGPMTATEHELGQRHMYDRETLARWHEGRADQVLQEPHRRVHLETARALRQDGEPVNAWPLVIVGVIGAVIWCYGVWSLVQDVARWSS